MYDPLTEPRLASNLPNTPSYWSSTTTLPKAKQLTKDIEVDVAIVGGGYTGLSCALNLLKLGINNICIVDANHIGWGCSSRNAGFVLPGSGRLSYPELVNRYGKNGALELHNSFLEGIDQIKSLATTYNLDKTESGYLKLAHSKNWYKKLQDTANYLQQNFDYRVEAIDQAELHKDYVIHSKAFGAVRYNNGFGLHPLKLVNAYVSELSAQQTMLFENSSVTNIDVIKDRHVILTQLGSITANKLVLATNGYTPKGFHSALNNRVLPVLTSVIVTRPLTDHELFESNFKTHQVMMDTRELKYYYRLLPDNRILFGGRGGITGKDADDPTYANRLLAELRASFSGLSDVTIDYSWSGWIAVSYDQMPHIYQSNNQVFYATGYCGSGVSFTSFAGKLLAELVAEQKVSSPVVSPLPHFPFAPARRLGQRLFYQYGRLKDHLT